VNKLACENIFVVRSLSLLLCKRNVFSYTCGPEVVRQVWPDNPTHLQLVREYLQASQALISLTSQFAQPPKKPHTPFWCRQRPFDEFCRNPVPFWCRQKPFDEFCRNPVPFWCRQRRTSSRSAPGAPDHDEQLRDSAANLSVTVFCMLVLFFEKKLEL
jgi:hypothetical protein